MDKDIDFMAHVDENTPPEVMLKMLLAAQRDKHVKKAANPFLVNISEQMSFMI
jgi:hypothetical protein